MHTISRPAPLPTAPAPEAKSQAAVKQPDTVSGTAQAGEAESTEMISPKFAAMARKEKALRNQAQALKAREDALKAKESEYETSYIPKAKLSERFKSDPVGLLNENGIDWDQLTAAILNQPGPQDQALSKLQLELEKVKEAQVQSQSKIESQQKQAYDQAVNQIRREAKLLVDSDAAYETIKETGSEDAVVQLIEEQFKIDGTVLSVEDAAREVEEYLIEEALKFARLKKVQQKLTPMQEIQKQNIPEKPSMRTLTNAQATSSKPLSNRERRERAILAFQGKL